MKKPNKLKTAATLTIHGPGRMTKKGRADIIRWLQQQAKHLAKHGKDYTDGRFRASFRYY